MTGIMDKITITSSVLSAIEAFFATTGNPPTERTTGDTLVAIIDRRPVSDADGIDVLGHWVVGIDTIVPKDSAFTYLRACGEYELREVWADELACDWTYLACVAIEVEG
jgi:hypothetical protein